jgi:hypothetical protein
MFSKTFRIARMIVLASFALSSAAWAANCSNASLSGTYGFVHSPVVGLSQATFDSTTGTYTGEVTENTDGVITTEPLTAKYAVASNCTVTARVRLGSHPAVSVLCAYVNRFFVPFPEARRDLVGIRHEAGLPDLHQCRS